MFQNKELPGAYINFVSAASANPALSERGIATMPLELDWGKDGEVFEVTNADFQKNSREIFGYDYTHEKLKGLRDLFLNAQTLYAYRLNSGGKRASNKYAYAACSGIRGNDLKLVIQADPDSEDMYTVQTLLDGVVVDQQTAAQAGELADNGYVVWKRGAELTLAETAGMPLEGGTNGEVNGGSHQAYLDKIEAYSYNTMGVSVEDSVTKSLYAAFCKRLRDEMGIKFQLVLHNFRADHYGIINVKNKALDDGRSESSLVYWVTGAEAGCAVNRSVQNTVYNGEFTVDAELTQNQLTQAIKNGEFTFHNVGSEIRVLDDINSMVTTSDTQGDVFKDNQTVRVCDQIGNDIAVLFNTKYLGIVPNDKPGRTSLWADIVKHHEQLQEVRAIEDFSDEDVTVEQGNSKKAVVVNDVITVINAMSKLYMTVTVS